jgi:hypothetical protein
MRMQTEVASDIWHIRPTPLSPRCGHALIDTTMPIGAIRATAVAYSSFVNHDRTLAFGGMDKHQAVARRGRVGGSAATSARPGGCRVQPDPAVVTIR